jgi:hypothetical protein
MQSILDRRITDDKSLDASHKTILHWTVLTGMHKCPSMALSKPKNLINAADGKGMTALHYAAQDSDLE